MGFLSQYFNFSSSYIPPDSQPKPIVDLLPFLRGGFALCLLATVLFLGYGIFGDSEMVFKAFKLDYFGYSLFATLIFGMTFGFRHAVALAKNGRENQALEISSTLLYLPFFGAVLLGILHFNDTGLYFAVVIFVFTSLFLNLKCLNQQTVYLLLLLVASFVLDLQEFAGSDQLLPSAFDLVVLSSVVILLNMVLQKIIKHFQSHAEVLLDQKQQNLNYQLKLESTVNERTLDLIKEKNFAIQESMAKSQFLANMSHELRTPLNAIIGYSELIQEEIATNATSEMQRVGSDIHRISSAGRNLLQLVNNVLDFSKLEANQTTIRITKLNIEEIVYDAVSLINPLLVKTQNEIHIAPIREDLIAYGDAQKLKQVLINLLSNANKFTSKGTILISIEEEEEYLGISVADTGVGIQQQKLDKLFKPFSQIENDFSRQFDGTGLGLAISKKFMELMNGTIEVQSYFGEGSIFTVKIEKISPAEQLKRDSKRNAFALK